MGRLLRWLVVAVFVFASPSLWLRATTPIIEPSQATPAEAALIFGAVVRDGTISPLQKERLDAAATLFRQGTVPVLMVSNTTNAAKVMAEELRRHVPPGAITLDVQAERSPDTCAEAARRGYRSVIFVTQRFHLPRLGLHCRRYGLDPQFVMADNAVRAPAPLATKIRVRGTRFIRETALIWGTLLRIYPHQPPA